MRLLALSLETKPDKSVICRAVIGQIGPTWHGQHDCFTYGSLFSWEPNMIMDLRAFQSCRTLSRASWAKRGGSRSWSGMSESEGGRKQDHEGVKFKKSQRNEEPNQPTSCEVYAARVRVSMIITFWIGRLAVSVFSDARWSVLTVLNALPGNSLHKKQ